MGKRKKKMTQFWQKKAEEKQKHYYNDICWWERDRFSSEVEIGKWIVWIKILKKRILKKI